MECHGFQFPSQTQIFSMSYCHDKLNIPPYYFCGGDRGAGDQEKRGREVYGRRGRGGGKREKKGKLCNIVQYFAIEKMQRGVSQQIQGRNGIKGYGEWQVYPPPPYFPLSLKNLPSFFLIIFPPLLFFTVCHIDLPSS